MYFVKKLGSLLKKGTAFLGIFLGASSFQVWGMEKKYQECFWVKDSRSGHPRVILVKKLENKEVSKEVSGEVIPYLNPDKELFVGSGREEEKTKSFLEEKVLKNKSSLSEKYPRFYWPNQVEERPKQREKRKVGCLKKEEEKSNSTFKKKQVRWAEQVEEMEKQKEQRRVKDIKKGSKGRLESLGWKSRTGIAFAGAGLGVGIFHGVASGWIQERVASWWKGKEGEEETKSFWTPHRTGFLACGVADILVGISLFGGFFWGLGKSFS